MFKNSTEALAIIFNTEFQGIKRYTGEVYRLACNFFSCLFKAKINVEKNHLEQIDKIENNLE